MVNKKEKRCKMCNHTVDSRSKNFLCVRCSKLNTEETKYKEYVEEWIKTGKLKTKSAPRGRIRRYLMERQGEKCSICTMINAWNGKKIVFVLDHIDGNSDNNHEKNLRLVCPNCDSQLDTFKSKNKNSARTSRKKYYR